MRDTNRQNNTLTPEQITKRIFNTSLLESEFNQIETLFKESKERSLITDEVNIISSACRKSIPVDLTEKAYVVYSIRIESELFQAIRILENSQITYQYPIIEDESNSYLKARLHSTQMNPTIHNGDIGYFKKVKDPKRFFIPGEIYLLQANDKYDTWFCRLDKSNDPDKVRVYYDGSKVEQYVPLSYFKTFWMLIAINRHVSQSF